MRVELFLALLPAPINNRQFPARGNCSFLWRRFLRLVQPLDVRVLFPRPRGFKRLLYRDQRVLLQKE